MVKDRGWLNLWWLSRKRYRKKFNYDEQWMDCDGVRMLGLLLSPPKGWPKKRFFRFLNKSQLQSNKVCTQFFVWRVKTRRHGQTWSERSSNGQLLLTDSDKKVLLDSVFTGWLDLKHCCLNLDGSVCFTRKRSRFIKSEFREVETRHRIAKNPT